MICLGYFELVDWWIVFLFGNSVDCGEVLCVCDVVCIVWWWFLLFLSITGGWGWLLFGLKLFVLFEVVVVVFRFCCLVLDGFVCWYLSAEFVLVCSLCCLDLLLWCYLLFNSVACGSFLLKCFLLVLTSVLLGFVCLYCCLCWLFALLGLMWFWFVLVWFAIARGLVCCLFVCFVWIWVCLCWFCNSVVSILLFGLLCPFYCLLGVV